jgi:hypothetical protein
MEDNKLNNIIIKSNQNNSYIKFSNSDSPSNDLNNYNNISINRCFAYCDSDPNCNGFSYNSNNCITKNNKVYPRGGSLTQSFNTDLYVKQPSDDIQKLIFDNPIYRSSYAVGGIENPIGYNDNLTTTKEIIKSINLNLSQLNYIQNQLNLKNNINQEALLKQEELLKMENDDLMNQLKKLENIESIISNKDRMIDQTTKNIEITNKNIKFITITIFLVIIILVLLILFYYNILSLSLISTIITLIIIIYLPIILYSYNIFNTKDILSYMMNKKDYKLAYKKLGFKNIEDIIKENEKMLKDKLSWIDNNCSCKNGNITDEEDNYLKFNSNLHKLSPGYFYYDDSAPPQLLVPNPGDYDNDQISWVDYSTNGILRFKNNNTTQEDDNNYYYNYQNKLDPRNKLTDKLNKSHTLVNNVTYTKNM